MNWLINNHICHAHVSNWKKSKSLRHLRCFCHPFSFCGGPAIFFLHSCRRESTVDGITALEWSKLDQEKVRYNCTQSDQLELTNPLLTHVLHRMKRLQTPAASSRHQKTPTNVFNLTISQPLPDVTALLRAENKVRSQWNRAISCNEDGSSHAVPSTAASTNTKHYRPIPPLQFHAQEMMLKWRAGE
jgi:hypothetical protein